MAHCRTWVVYSCDFTRMNLVFIHPCTMNGRNAGSNKESFRNTHTTLLQNWRTTYIQACVNSQRSCTHMTNMSL
jgi:hypothetical protein